MKCFFPLAVLMLAMPALAAERLPTEFTGAAETAMNVCFQTAQGTQNPPDRKIAACETADKTLVALKTQYANAQRWEKDRVALYHAITQNLLATSYSAADKVRSQRVCDSAEHAWVTLGAVGANSEDADNVQAFAQSLLPVVKLCRAEMGTPAWGRAL